MRQGEENEMGDWASEGGRMKQRKGCIVSEGGQREGGEYRAGLQRLHGRGLTAGGAPGTTRPEVT